jgi:hypothetical protein
MWRFALLPSLCRKRTLFVWTETGAEPHAKTMRREETRYLVHNQRPSLDVAHKRPPYDSTIERLIASPMPLP